MTLGRAIDKVRKNMARLGLERQPECYCVSEAVYRLAGGKKAGLKAMRIGTPQDPIHWYLSTEHDEIIDLTAGQFINVYARRLPNYNKAKGAAFYPKVSSLARKLMK